MDDQPKRQIFCGDMLEVLPQFPDRSFDLCFTSPPYENARTYGIDFKAKGEAFVEWCKPRFMECLRVTNGLICWVINNKTRQFRSSCVIECLVADLHRSGVNFRKSQVFHRVGIPGSGGPDYMRDDWEYVLVAQGFKGKLPWSNNTACGHAPKWAPGGAMSYRQSDGARVNGILRAYEPPKNANPGNVIKCKVGGGLMGSPLAHENEAPFPESLAERFILPFCRPGGTVLDPFCGSGTTGSVAIKHGRKFVGIDIREEQCELTLRRLDGVQKVMC